MKVLFFSELRSFGGAEKFLCDVSAALAGNRHEITIAIRYYDREELDKMLRYLGAVSGVRIQASVGNPCLVCDMPGRVAGFLRVLRQSRPGIIHFNLAGLHYANPEIFLARFARVPVISTVHSIPEAGGVRPVTESFKIFIRTRLVYPVPDRYTVVTDTSGDVLSRVGHIPRDRIITIPNGIDFEKFGLLCMPASFQQYGIDERTFLVGAVGRLDRAKAHHVLLRAVRELVDRGIPDTTRFLIIGDGEWRDCLKELAASMGISDRVIFTGYVQPGQLPALISRMNIFVISSAVESLPYTLIEAMACGVPVVSTAVGGIPEIITDGYNGLLVNPGDHSALAQKIMMLMASPDTRSRMVSNAKDGRLDRFSLRDTVRDLELLYQVVVREKGAG